MSHTADFSQAVAFALAHETPWPRDIEAHLRAGAFEPPPWNEILGPVAPRGAPNGLLLRGGKQVAAWGDVARADMTFSVAKSYLAILAGIAVGDGLIADLDAPVGKTVRDGGFDGPHNGAITWRHLLTQTSECKAFCSTSPTRSIGTAASPHPVRRWQATKRVTRGR